MVSICMYFQVHQPHRLKKFPIFDIGKNHTYFNEDKNEKVMKKVAKKCYLPANQILLDTINQVDSFKAAFSISGCALEQFEKFSPEVLQSFQDLVATGKVEMLSETYHHSLASVFNKEEFMRQVGLHTKKIKSTFGVIPKVFRNTELIFNNEIASTAQELGFSGVLAESVDKIMEWRSPNFVYRAKGSNIGLLLKNYTLSDDIAFRFGEMGWKEYPLTANKFASWVNAINGNGVVLNLFMDYETFGEHQWAEKGIFDFLRALPGELLRHPDNNFVTPGEAVKMYKPVGELDIPHMTSWADTERDLTAWLGNKMQEEAAHKLYSLEQPIMNSNMPELIDDWRKLQTSDHFYYMCTKWFSDGDVHKYFNPFDSPYDAFITFMNIMNDLRLRLKEVNPMNGEKNWLADVAQDKVFQLNDGRPVKNLMELSAAFRTMNPGTYKHHTNGRNDFSDWVKLVVGDEVLAQNLEKCKRSVMAAKMVEERIKSM